ncbi:MAG TPA: type II toxin-antitoxin system death-on-curing family toxin [Longimicrobium sp.]|jgi:death-on-curing protein|nr:type II toxin-antitoxin system death-on-curing family toxin [Longimicrobium sp.]
MDEPLRIDPGTLHLIHAQQLERFGGSPRVLDRGVVESALNRPVNRWHYGGLEVDLADLAAAYLYGFAQSQGFVDGNKRTGLAVALVFLAVNGKRLHVAGEELYRLTMSVADERIRIPEDAVAAWFRERI